MKSSIASKAMDEDVQVANYWFRELHVKSAGLNDSWIERRSMGIIACQSLGAQMVRRKVDEGNRPGKF